MHPTCTHIGGILNVKSVSNYKITRMLTGSVSECMDEESYLTAASAARFNQLTFQKALAMVPKNVKEKYLKYGRKLSFGPDLVHSLAPEWLVSVARVAAKTSGSEDVYSHESIFTAPVYISPRGQEAGRMGGGYYVKLISLGFALEWIYTWSKR